MIDDDENGLEGDSTNESYLENPRGQEQQEIPENQVLDR
jgi:hypothetical protein